MQDNLLASPCQGDMPDQELSAWLAFDQLLTAGIGLKVQHVLRLRDQFDSLAAAWQSNRDDIIALVGLAAKTADAMVAARAKIEPERLLEHVRGLSVSFYPYVHDLYPLRLRHISDPPLNLYCQGKLVETDFYHAIAVVGTRKPSAYGQNQARIFASQLSRAGVTIVSGMAMGIDTQSHWGAIESGGRTLAVLASSPEICSPKSNRRLYEAIKDGHGAVLSEYFPGTEPEKWRFPARNRIVSGISSAVLVVEAPEDSGALITARMAFEQDRDVFCIPGRADSPSSRGTHELIRRPQAKLVRDCKDILSDLDWVSAPRNQKAPMIVQLFGREQEIYNILSSEPVHFDALVEQTKMPVGELSANLTMLELAGLVKRHTGDLYSRCS